MRAVRKFLAALFRELFKPKLWYVAEFKYDGRRYRRTGWNSERHKHRDTAVTRAEWLNNSVPVDGVLLYIVLKEVE